MKTIAASSSLAAELWALREGLLLCIDLQAQAMVVELEDRKSVV